jgi:Icc protein
MPRLLQLTDSHLMDDPRDRLKGFETEQGFRRCLDRGVVRIRPEHLLMTGDLVHDAGRPAYERLCGHCTRSGVTGYALPGNHDDPTLMAELLDRPPLESGGSHRLDGWQVIMLNSVEPGRVGGRLHREELERLEDSLSDRPDHHALVCLHHQAIGVDSPWMDDIGLSNTDALLSVIDRHPAVRGVLWGHIHQVFDATHKGVRYLGSPSTCIQFRPGVERMMLDPRLPGARWLVLGENGAIHTDILRIHPRIDRLISGGQTGVDRAALDAADALGLEIGGWCPKGRRTEDGTLPAYYPLRETPQERYAQRTEWNVRDADATVIVASRPLRGGTALTADIARRLDRPLLIVDPGRPADPASFEQWLAAHEIAILNVAGPRESSQPGIGGAARSLLTNLLTGVG